MSGEAKPKSQPANTTHHTSQIAHPKPIAHHPAPPPPSHGSIGCGIITFIVGLLFVRAIPWLGVIITLLGGALVLQGLNSYGVVAWLLVIAGIAVVIALAVKAARSQRTGLASGASAAVDDVPLTPIHPPGIVSESNELFYWQEQATWLEFENQRQYSGGYGGVRVRLARGLSLGSGRTGGRSKSIAVVNATAGTIYLSNQRLLFIAPAFSREVVLKSAVYFAKGSESIQVDLPNKFSIEIKTGNKRLGTVLDKILSGDFGPHQIVESPSSTKQQTDNPMSVEQSIQTKMSVVNQLATLLDSEFPKLQADFDQARTGAMSISGVALTPAQSLTWMHEKLAGLRSAALSLPTIVGTDLAATLAVSTDPVQTSAAQAKWVHECAACCYKLTDWELDIKTTNLDPLFGHAQTLMRGLSSEFFSSIMQVRTQLHTVDASNASKEPFEVVSRPSGNAFKPLMDEIERLTKLIQGGQQ